METTEKPTVEQGERYRKHSALSHWRSLPDVDPASVVRAVPYKHEGTTYAEDGIRITGSKEWVEAVMSQIKTLLHKENNETRIQINLAETNDRYTGKLTGSWVASIQVHERGRRGH